MKIIQLVITLFITIGLIYVLDNPVRIPGKKEKILPPPGSFFSPQTGFWQNAESTDFKSQTVELPNFPGKAEVIFDDRMVPHIFAETIEDAVFAQGYVEASMRLFQMDLISRLANGRLAEVLGEDLLKIDQLNRRKGLVFGAENSVNSWRKAPASYRIIEAYTQGVNAWIDRMDPREWPLEFKLLNYTPEHWSVFKTALIKKYMDHTLCFREDDLESSNALQVLGPELFEKLFPEINPQQSPVIPGGTAWDFTPVKISTPTGNSDESIGVLPFSPLPKERELVGSNNWAVSGTKTASGHPILCNDPHLELSLPSIWFELQIHTTDNNVYGVSIAGLPGVIIGFNEQIAWGVTNVGHDVADYYRIDWTDEAKTSYLYDGQVKKARQVIENYKVRNRKEVVSDTVTWTEWGPVVYQSKDNPWQDLALRWIAHDAPNSGDIMTFLGLNTARNYDDYQESLGHFNFPAQNFAVATRSGDIGITVNGDFPIKRDQQGRFVQDGSSSANAWQGFIPKSQVPAVKNPEQGFVGSANQRSTDKTYPYYYNSSGFDNYRGRFLHQELTKGANLTPQDMMKLQNSNYSLLAAEALPLLLAMTDADSLTSAEKNQYSKLGAWSYRYEKDMAEPVFFEKWFRNFYEETFDEVLVWKDSIPILMPESWRLIELMAMDRNDPVFDKTQTGTIESAGMLALSSFRQTCRELADELADPTFNWAGYKQTRIMHLTKIPAFSRTHLNVGGNRQALNAISETHGPSWRMVVDLGDEVKGWGVFPGGQSGNPGSKFYDTGIDLWIQGEYNECLFMKTRQDDPEKVLFTLSINP